MSANDLVITRTLPAPRWRVWKAWTDPVEAKAWGPKGFTTTVREMSFEAGGPWRTVMIAPDGREFRQHGVTKAVVPEELLSFTFIWDDTPDIEMLVTVRFEDAGEQTVMHFVQTGIVSPESRDGHRGGWTEAFEQLESLVQRK